MRSAVDWVAGLSSWPADGFGLDRIRALLRELGDPQRRYPAVHVVGTNGKSTTARLTEALLSAEGLRVGTYLSPHVSGWGERIRVDGDEADFEAAVARVRPAAETLGATQFEVLTAAALTAFAAAEVDVAVVEAGLGGRHDATNVLDARIVVLTNVALDHTDVLGETREQIAAEKLAVVPAGAAVVLGEPEWRDAALAAGAEVALFAGGSNLAVAIAAAETFLGRPVDPHAADGVALPGRLEHKGDSPYEVWAGAHNLHGLGWLLPRLAVKPWVLLVSVLAEKEVDGMLAALSVLGERLIATASSNPRSLPAEQLAERARARFAQVEAVDGPSRALARAREVAGRDGAVLVTGSLYLLVDLLAQEEQSERWRNLVIG